jgi:hypothetical protein
VLDRSAVRADETDVDPPCATDGTPLAYPFGTFETDETDDLARCHFCGL